MFVLGRAIAGEQLGAEASESQGAAQFEGLFEGVGATDAVPQDVP